MGKMGLEQAQVTQSVQLLTVLFNSFTAALARSIGRPGRRRSQPALDRYRLFTLKHLDAIALRLLQMGSGVRADFQVSTPGKLLGAETRLLDHLRLAVTQARENRDWTTEDLLRLILRDREELFPRLEELEQQESILEHIWDDEGLSMFQNPIH